MTKKSLYEKSLRDLIKVSSGQDETERKIEVSDNLALVNHLTPDDGIQYMLAVQMTAAHNKAIDEVYMANQSKHDTKRDRHLSRACGLMDLFLKQIAARDSYRHKWSHSIIEKDTVYYKKPTPFISEQKLELPSHGKVNAIPLLKPSHRSCRQQVEENKDEEHSDVC